jgi:hypothetical protein
MGMYGRHERVLERERENPGTRTQLRLKTPRHTRTRNKAIVLHYKQGSGYRQYQRWMESEQLRFSWSFSTT